jgi:hypothetical protein
MASKKKKRAKGYTRKWASTEIEEISISAVAVPTVGMKIIV